MPITREEALLNTMATGVASGVEPITREEQYLSYIAGESYTKPDSPITRKEVFLDKIPQAGSGGGGVTIRNQNKTITANGTYKADSGYTGLGTVTVDVPNDSEAEELLTALYQKTVTTEQCDKILVKHKGGFPEYAFYYCKNITSLDLRADNSKPYILQQAFRYCTGLKTINMSKDSNVNVLATSCFANCTALEKVTLSPQIENVGGTVFDHCTALKEIVFQSAANVASSAFTNDNALEWLDYSGVSGDTIPALVDTNQMSYTSWKALVPVGWMREMKQATNWVKYPSRIVCSRYVGEEFRVYSWGVAEAAPEDSGFLLYINGEPVGDLYSLDGAVFESVQCVGIDRKDGYAGGAVSLKNEYGEEMPFEYGIDVSVGPNWHLNLKSPAQKEV